MLGETNTDDKGNYIRELERQKNTYKFTETEEELIDFVIKNRREPNYVDQRRLYQVLLRLRKKLRVAENKSIVLSNLFELFNSVKVSSKLVVRDVD